jgi:glycine/betaine/sarcosine/D-proline reductase family selenoprotein B
VISKQIESLGIPVAQICTMIPVALEVGSIRLVPSGGIISPTGNPSLSAGEEKAFRRQVVLKALRSLEDPIQSQKVYDAP